MHRTYITPRGKHCVTTSLRHLSQDEDRIVARHGLETEIRVPVVVRLDLLLVAALLGSIDCLAVLRADAVDLVVLAAMVSLRVEQGVDVKPVALRSSRELTELDGNLLDDLGINAVLAAENNNTTLGDLLSPYPLVKEFMRVTNEIYL